MVVACDPRPIVAPAILVWPKGAGSAAQCLLDVLDFSSAVREAEDEALPGTVGDAHKLERFIAGRGGGGQRIELGPHLPYLAITAVEKEVGAD